MSKQEWMKQALNPGEQYGGFLLGQHGAPDCHIIVVSRKKNVTLGEAQAWAAERHAQLPSAREMFSIYLNRADLFEDSFDRYWTSEACPPSRYATGALLNKPHQSVARPAALSLYASMSSSCDIIERREEGRAKNDAMAVRRVAADGTPLADMVPVVPVELLRKLDERLLAAGFKRRQKGELTQQMLLRQEVLQWTGRIKPCRFQLTLSPQRDVSLSSTPWARDINWNFRYTRNHSQGEWYSAKQMGQASAKEGLVEDILAALEELQSKAAK